MTDPIDVVPVPESQMFSAIPSRDPALNEVLDPETLFQEINARRARIENAELLQHLRGL